MKYIIQLFILMTSVELTCLAMARLHTSHQQLNSRVFLFIFKDIYLHCISAMYLIYQSISLRDQFIMLYLVSTGNQPIIKKTNYTTNQGAHRVQQNLPLSNV